MSLVFDNKEIFIFTHKLPLNAKNLCEDLNFYIAKGEIG